MASGDSLFTFLPFDNEPPASGYATPDLRNAHPCLSFDASTDEAAVFTGVLPRHYGGGGITVDLHFAATSATSGNAVLTAAFERIGDGVQNIDSDGFASAQSVTSAVPGVSGNVKIISIPFTNGAQIDSLAVGEAFRLKVTRDADNGSDTATGDLELIAVHGRET